IGPKMEPLIVKYIEWLGWLVIFILVVIIFYYAGFNHG
ncbi:MAG: DedA family protein, partial [Sulfurimonas sp.]